eukprot:Hpha_TRINITY_DN35550_c0_g1::TRINITY_DN35550_c0_g1_i1::g.84522::m.84522
MLGVAVVIWCGAGHKYKPMKGNEHNYLAEDPDCLPTSRNGYTGFTAGEGQVRVYAPAAVREKLIRNSPLPLQTNYSEWCLPWAGRSCGHSHAYTAALPNASTTPEQLPVLPLPRVPHLDGGFGASFDVWNKMHVGRGEGGNPSRVILADILKTVKGSDEVAGEWA